MVGGGIVGVFEGWLAGVNDLFRMVSCVEELLEKCVVT